MSELKGTLLAIILTLIIFGTMSVAMTKAFDDLSNGVKEQVTETITDLNA